MKATALSPTRALRRPRHLDWRAVFGVLLLLVATAGSITFWSASSNTRTVLVATRDLPAGAALSESDLAVARVRIDDSMYEVALPAGEVTSIAGKQLAEPVHTQQLLVRGQVSSRPPLGEGVMALTVAITPESAVGGRLRPGDIVQVLLTTDKGKPEAHTTIVLARAMVYDVGHEQRLMVVNTQATDGSGTQGQVRWLTLIVTQEQAVRLAQAKWAGELDVALLPPEQQ